MNRRYKTVIWFQPRSGDIPLATGVSPWGRAHRDPTTGLRGCCPTTELGRQAERRRSAAGQLYLRKLVILALLVFAPVAQAADRARVKEIGQSLMCTCGCNQLLAGCNHLDCPRSIPMEKELAGMIDKGMSKDDILSAFVAKYGAKVLSAPPTKGAFNISAWIMPFVALLAGGFMVIYLLRTWRARTTPAPLGPVDDARYRQQLEEELKKFTPED